MSMAKVERGSRSGSTGPGMGDRYGPGRLSEWNGLPLPPPPEAAQPATSNNAVARHPTRPAVVPAKGRERVCREWTTRTPRLSGADGHKDATGVTGQGRVTGLQ